MTRFSSKRTAQIIVVLLCAAAVKFYYSTASVNQLRWILTPTTFLVDLVSGSRFQFESYAGYVNSDHSFIITASCAGVNFLITAFLMLTMRKLWWARSQTPSPGLEWRYIPLSALVAFLTTLVVNTVRISTALRIRQVRWETGWFNRNQLHRFEGIFIYFGFLLLLYVLSERMRFGDASSSEIASSSAVETGDSRSSSSLFHRAGFPLLIYYATTLGLPLAISIYRSDTLTAEFWEHSLFVLITPLLLILPLATFRYYRIHRARRNA
jgi:exosortase K